jgi:hypothetical protein
MPGTDDTRDTGDTGSYTRTYERDHIMVTLKRFGHEVVFTLGLCFFAICISTIANAQQPPSYQVDAAWPKQLPKNMVLGPASAVTVDKDNHVWVLQRPATTTKNELGAAQDPPTSECCVAAPPVIEFDTKGNFIKAWGGPGAGYDWPVMEHSIYVDQTGNVWISGNGMGDRQVIKFTNDGKFLMQIGHPAQGNADSLSKTLLDGVTGVDVDEKAHEVYLADGDKNRRIIVFDSNTGEFKRMWGAYGHVPDDKDLGPYKIGEPPAQQFRPGIHCARISVDGFVYACDRADDRIQVFTKEGKFVKEFYIRPPESTCKTCMHQPSDLIFSRDVGQNFLIVTDEMNNVVWILRRSDGAVVSAIGHTGSNAGQFHIVHGVGSDSDGNVYTAELGPSNRVQKFVLVRGKAASQAK